MINNKDIKKGLVLIATSGISENPRRMLITKTLPCPSQESGGLELHVAYSYNEGVSWTNSPGMETASSIRILIRDKKFDVLEYIDVSKLSFQEPKKHVTPSNDGRLMFTHRGLKTKVTGPTPPPQIEPVLNSFGVCKGYMVNGAKMHTDLNLLVKSLPDITPHTIIGYTLDLDTTNPKAPVFSSKLSVFNASDDILLSLEMILGLPTTTALDETHSRATWNVTDNNLKIGRNAVKDLSKVQYGDSLMTAITTNAPSIVWVREYSIETPTIA